jgi:hypothetical protein
MYAAMLAAVTDISMAPMHYKTLPQPDPGVGNRAQPALSAIRNCALRSSR